mmetsp:Transcript_19256/g.41627  ORF Transcript_19256/g.41627 Transcript_19256/m.41627 type:complete len:240 (-) Transcript_19256:1169-1888(-)
MQHIPPSPPTSSSPSLPPQHPAPPRQLQHSPMLHTTLCTTLALQQPPQPQTALLHQLLSRCMPTATPLLTPRSSRQQHSSRSSSRHTHPSSLATPTSFHPAPPMQTPQPPHKPHSSSSSSRPPITLTTLPQPPTHLTLSLLSRHRSSRHHLCCQGPQASPVLLQHPPAAHHPSAPCTTPPSPALACQLGSCATPWHCPLTRSASCWAARAPTSAPSAWPLARASRCTTAPRPAVTGTWS